MGTVRVPNTYRINVSCKLRDGQVLQAAGTSHGTDLFDALDQWDEMPDWGRDEERATEDVVKMSISVELA